MKKFQILKDIILRTDLSAAELRIACYILGESIGDTGRCIISNRQLETKLRLNHGTIIRLKKSLRKKKVLTFTTSQELGARLHLASSYQFYLPKEGVQRCTQLIDHPAPTLGATPHPEQTINNPATKKWLAEHRAKHEQARAVAQKSDDAAAIQQFNRSAWRSRQ